MVVVVLMSLISVETHAQNEEDTCSCFSYEEVESIFLRGKQQIETGGTSDCSAQDYSVECNAEVAIWDQNYNLIAKARVDWYDFDPGGCEYIDTTGDPVIERKVKWPHPAPEAAARVCFNIISNVIAKSDTDGNCYTYP